MGISRRFKTVVNLKDTDYSSLGRSVGNIVRNVNILRPAVVKNVLGRLRGIA